MAIGGFLDRQGPMQGCFPGGPIIQLCPRWDAPRQPEEGSAAQPLCDMHGRLYVLISPGDNPVDNSMPGASGGTGRLGTGSICKLLGFVIFLP